MILLLCCYGIKLDLQYTHNLKRRSSIILSYLPIHSNVFSSPAGVYLLLTKMTQFKPGRMEKIAPIEKDIISKRCAPVSYGYHGHKEGWGAIHLLHLGLSSVRMREEKVHVIQ